MSTDQLVCPSCHTPLPEAAAFCYVCGTPTPTGTRDGEAATTRPSLQSAAAVVDVRKRLEKALGTNFTVGELVGRGGFAEVFSVRDNRLKRELAVKVLSPELVVNQPMLQRFRREAEAVAALRHAGIVPIYDIGESGGIAYIMMPLIKGETLKKRLDREGRLQINEVRRVLKEIATALSVAHDAGLVHRDIKPENVMLEGPKQQILVMDFGIAKALDPDQTGMTSSGLIVGTPHFMSPEQASGEAVDARSDQYSLAVLGYRMVTGAHPFDGETTRALLYKQVFETPPPARERFPDVPLSLSDALHRGMAKDPKDRYATIDEFAAAVLQEDTNERAALPPPKLRSKSKPPEPSKDKVPAKGEAKASTKPAPAKPTGGSRRFAIVALGAVATIAAVAVFMTLNKGGAATPTDVAQQPPAATQPPPAAAVAPPPPSGGQKAPPPAPSSPRGSGTKTADPPPTTASAPAPVQPPPAAAPATCADAVRASSWAAAATQCATEAEQGNVAAMMAMGGMSEKGQGVAADPAVAATWYQKASAAGSAEAGYKLGEMYEEGRGVSKNLPEAANSYSQAARRGVTPAMRSLARMLATGTGVKKNEAEAVSWYRRAATANDIPSMLRLAEMYINGRGVSKNEGEAVRLYQRAADLGDAEGRYQLAMVYFNGRGIAKNDSLGLVWLRRSATQGFEPAQQELARRAP
jgi:serine/threonine-protein kinase